MEASKEMPLYKCHKEVSALKIASILHDEPELSALITPEDEGYAPFKVDKVYMQKHKPEAGGYYVVYADGYESFSPAQAFKEGYTKI